MYRLLGVLSLVMGAAAANAAPITYTAVLGCGSTCVTVALSWVNMPVPITTAEVQDNFGETLFSLNVPSPPVSTGSIIPNPQTVFGLSTTTVRLITNGQPIASAGSLVAAEALADDLCCCQPTYANLVLANKDEGISISQRFVATDVPEPATWSMLGAGIGLLLWRSSSKFSRNR